MEELPLQQGRLSSIHRINRFMLLLTGYILRVVSLDAQGLWRDEVDQWRFALSPLSDLLTNFTQRGWNGPLFSPMLRVWIALTGDSVFSMRYLSLIFGWLCISLMYVLGTRLFNRTTGTWASWLWAASPYMVWYAQEVKMYTWVPLLVLAALYGLERAIVRPSLGWWFVVFLSATLAFYSHILAALVIPVLLGWFLLTANRHPRAWIGGTVTFLLLTLPYSPLLIWQIPLVFVVRETGFPSYTLSKMILTLLTGWTTGITLGSWSNGWLPNVLMGFMSMLALLGCGALFKRFRQLSKLLVWLLIPLLAIWFISINSPLFADRYLVWTAPAFLLMVAAGVTALKDIHPMVMRLLGVLALLTAAPALINQAVHPVKPQFAAVVDYVMANSSADALVLFQIPYNAHVFGYYARNQVYRWAEAPYTNWRGDDGNYLVDEDYVGQEMAKITGAYTDIWMVYSEVNLWDDRELVKKWLDERFEVVDVLEVQGVTLTHYQVQSSR